MLSVAHHDLLAGIGDMLARVRALLYIPIHVPPDDYRDRIGLLRVQHPHVMDEEGISLLLERVDGDGAHALLHVPAL